ncbi:hypothetical protein M3Y99_00188400 [Aphelenchoides fujianensis]|nr:hypothetical protein M3Y99_00188400 [Aphelenchoides fujianensis]
MAAITTSNPTPRLERANSISGSRSSLPLCPDLSPSQVLAIKRSWRHINTKGLASVIRRCFQRLESSSQSAAAAFQLPPAQSGVAVRSVSDHTKFFLAFLQRIVDGEPDLELELKRIGAKHAFLEEECGVGVRDIERLGGCLSSRAWRRLLAEILHHFRDGFDAELRFQKRRSSFQPGVRRNSMPNSNRKTSLKVDASSVTRKLSNF